MRTRDRFAALAALLLLCAAAPAQDSGSAIDSLDSNQLANALARFKMTEMLSAVKGAVGRKATLDDPELGMAARDKLVAEITGHYRALMESAGAELAAKKEADKPKAQIKSFEVRFEFAEFLGNKVIENNVLNLLLLRAMPTDAGYIVQQTGEAVRVLDQLNRDIEQTMQLWRRDTRRLVVDMPQLEELKKRAAYSSGWIYFNRGLALRGVADKQKEREGLLRDAIVQTNDFADGEAESGVKYWALLLRGMALRELGEYGTAAPALKAAGAAADVQIRWRSQFELARIAIESGDKQAKTAVQAFSKSAIEIPGVQQIAVDILEALLLDHLYDTQAKNDPKLGVEGHKALLDFANKYSEPDKLRDWCYIITNKYGSVKPDPKDPKVDSMVLLAAGVLAIFNKEQDYGVSLLNKVLAGNDPLSLAARPLALWYLAVPESQARETAVKAASRFKDLAEQYPKHQLAPLAAKNAVIAYRAIFKERRAATPPQPILSVLQMNYISSLEHLLANFADSDKESAKCYLDLATEYLMRAQRSTAGPVRLDLRKKAIAAFEKVPKDKDEVGPYMSARALALELRYQTWGQDLSKTEAASAAPGLIQDLLAYAKQAVEEAALAKDPELKKNLMEWGARAEFHVGAVLYDTQENRAREILDSLSKKWPGTVAEAEAMEFVISKLIITEKTEKASALLEEFRKTHPLEAEGLIKIVLQQVQSRLEDLSVRRDRELELKKYRGIFYIFTKDLYERVKNDPIEKRFSYQQMFASGLVEKGYTESKPEQAAEYFRQALALFQDCDKFTGSRDDVQRKKIDAEYGAQLREMLALAVDAPGCRKAHAAYVDLLKKQGEDPATTGAPAILDNMVQYLEKAKKAEEVKLRLERFRAKLKELVDGMRDKAKKNLPVDIDTVAGMARCQRALKQYKESCELYNTVVDILQYYRRLPAGSDRDRLAKFYWRLLLEYCKTLLEAYPQDAKAMKSLGLKIVVARSQEEEMGGLAAEFSAIETQAGEAASTAPPKPGN